MKIPMSREEEIHPGEDRVRRNDEGSAGGESTQQNCSQLSIFRRNLVIGELFFTKT